MLSRIKLISKKELTKNKKYIHFNNSEIIRIPLVLQNNTNCECLVKEGMAVKKGMIIGNATTKIANLPIISSVSGKVTGINQVMVANGDLVPCVTIKNNFKEIGNRRGVKKNITSYTKEEFIYTLQSCAVVGMGGSGFPTYIKYQANNLNTLIVNAVECEPYITSDQSLIKEKVEVLLETIDAIGEINGFKKLYIAVKESNSQAIEAFNNYLGTYPNIKLFIVKDAYPMGWEKHLITDITGLTYNNLPSEIGIVVNNISTIYAIYKALKYGRACSSRIVTFTGEMLKKPVNVKVKIGTLVSDVLKEIGIKKGDYKLIIGGPMMGNSVSSNDVVITKEVNCVLVLPIIKEADKVNCLRCGHCVQNCPANLCPVLIMNNLNNIEKLKELHPEKCVECGLCSYICPSKINVREYVKDAKGKVRK